MNEKIISVCICSIFIISIVFSVAVGKQYSIVEKVSDDNIIDNFINPNEYRRIDCNLMQSSTDTYLINTVWGQWGPYNTKCPMNNEPGRPPFQERLGCWSVAIGQIINYHHEYYDLQTQGINRNQLSNDPFWIRYFGGIEDDTAVSMQRTSDSGFIICANTESYSEDNMILLVKTDSNGVEQWRKTHGGSGFNYYVYDVIQTSDGGYLIGGNLDYADYELLGILIKTDEFGNLEWIRYYAGEYVYECIKSVKQTTDGGFICTGYTCERVDYDEYDDIEWKWTGIWLIKTDNNGYVEWEKDWWGGYDGAHGFGNDVIQSSDGGYVIAGYEYGRGTWIIKTDSNGKVIWESDANFGIPDAVIESSDDHYAFCGYGEGPIGIISKIYNDGREWWCTVLDGFYKDIIELSVGGYAIVGGDAENNTDAKLVTFDENGEYTGSAQLAGPTYEMLNGVIEDENAFGIFLGTTDSEGSGKKDVMLFRATLDWAKPEIEITQPAENSLYIGGRKVLPLNRLTVVIGTLDIEIDANDIFCGMDAVHLFIEDVELAVLTSPPYTWKWVERIPGIYKISVVGYDKFGNYESDEITVLKIF